jgi:hypothetical protein
MYALILDRLLLLSTADHSPAHVGVDADKCRNRLPPGGTGDIRRSHGCPLVAMGLDQRLCMQDILPYSWLV